MVKDPYKVLEIPETATKEEIKKAYRKKAKLYHPDLHPDDPEAAEKMNEINEAYDMLSNPKKYKNQRGYSSAGYGNSSYGGNSDYGWERQGGRSSYESYSSYDDIFTPKPEENDSLLIRNAINYMTNNRYDEALNILNSIVSSERNARWFYLSALANYGAGNRIRAREHIYKACSMDPENYTYQDLSDRLDIMARTYTDAPEFTDVICPNTSAFNICFWICCAINMCTSCGDPGGGGM